ncbi:MAG TPA: methyltransferase domain-containing protein [Thermomicrobiales bacterium]|nr:methyltransferase domain-containing protein [Thermomicrobiales bacterium]
MTDEEGAERKAQTRAIFNRLAADYDVAGPGCFAWYGRRLVEVAGVASGDRVLDVATGRGAVLVPAAERVGTGGSVTGIDLSEEMVGIASGEGARFGDRAQVRLMDAEQLDFPDETFDHVLCGFGIMFFPNCDRTLGEFRRVLKPGGRIGVSTWQVSQAHDLSVVLNELGLGRGDEPGWITDPDQLNGVLSSAGFTGVRVIADAHAFRYESIDQYWQNARGTGLRRWLDTLDTEQTERVRVALIERVQASIRPDGLHLSATALLATARLTQHEAA